MSLLSCNKVRQSGQALLLLIAILVVGVSWTLVSALGNVSSNRASLQVDNARVLAEAKAALIGWVAQNALDSTENNPGRLPCPQNWGDVGTANEGRAGATCSATAAGWLPWKTLGLAKLLDASGQQLWYVVSPGWHMLPSGATLDINSNTPGQLSLRSAQQPLAGTPAVALIIAPGPPLVIAPTANQTAAGCTARSQSRNLNFPSVTPNILDFLDCQNGTTADNTFTTSVVENSSNLVFNDQVVAVTTDDIMPALEGAIARRIELQVAPALKSVYADPLWGTSSTTPAFAFAAPFTDPSTATYLGQVGLYQGLLPFNYHSSSCSGDPRCESDAVTWSSPSLTTTGGTGYLPSSPSCSVIASAPTCEGYYYGGSLNIVLTNEVADVTKGLRTFTASDHTTTVWYWRWVSTGGGSWQGPTVLTGATSRKLVSSGAAQFIASASLPSVSTWGYYHIEESRPALADHSILSSSSASTGWFVRNEWYRLTYYAISSSHAPGGSLSCIDGVTCLRVTNLTDPTTQQAILALAGRALPLRSQTRPSSGLTNYLEDGALVFNQAPISATFNDRFISVSKQ